MAWRVLGEAKQRILKSETRCWHKMLSLPLILASLTLATLLPSAAQASGDCDQVVFDTVQRMQIEYGLNVLQPSAIPIGTRQTPYPGSLMRMFLMRTIFSGPGSNNPYTQRATMKARDFMSSPRLQLQLATRVLDSCRDTSIVAFGFANSGYSIPYFRMSSGVVREGVSLDCLRGDGDDLQWGYYYDC